MNCHQAAAKTLTVFPANMVAELVGLTAAKVCDTASGIYEPSCQQATRLVHLWEAMEALLEVEDISTVRRLIREGWTIEMHPVLPASLLQTSEGSCTLVKEAEAYARLLRINARKRVRMIHSNVVFLDFRSRRGPSLGANP